MLFNQCGIQFNSIHERLQKSHHQTLFRPEKHTRQIELQVKKDCDSGDGQKMTSTGQSINILPGRKQARGQSS